MNGVVRTLTAFTICWVSAAAALAQGGTPTPPPDARPGEEVLVDAITEASPAAELAAVPVSSFSAAPTLSRIEVVFSIDCSGSMGRSIDGAKAKVVQIVSNIASAYPGIPLRVGLIRYGDGMQRYQLFPLSDNPQEVYNNIRTTSIDVKASHELVGFFVRKAVTEIGWSAQDSVLKLLYMVGNETAVQGEPDYRTTVPEAVRQGIIVNAVYCAHPIELTTQDRVSAMKATWMHLAQLGGGEYIQVGGREPDTRVSLLQWANSWALRSRQQPPGMSSMQGIRSALPGRTGAGAIRMPQGMSGGTRRYR